jgi:hypothetical protein
MAEVSVPSYTTIDLTDIDISDYIDTIEVDIDIHVIGDVISQGDVEQNEVLELIDHDAIVSFCEDNIDPDDFPDDFVVKLVEERNDLVKLALGGKEETIREAAQSLLSRLMNEAWFDAQAITKDLVRHLLANRHLRLGVADAIGEHYVGAALSPIVPEAPEEPEEAEAEVAETVAEAAN